LLSLGTYFHLKNQYQKLEKLWEELLMKIQEYCDNVPYTIEAYKSLRPEDTKKPEIIIDLKIKCLEAKKIPHTILKTYKELDSNLDALFDLRHKDSKIAHDIRFVEAFTEFKRIEENLNKTANDYESIRHLYEKNLKKSLSFIIGKIGKFKKMPEFSNFYV
jgi:hypothetical protein